MRGAIEDDQLFRPHSSLVIRTNLRQPRPVIVCIVSGHDEQLAALHLLWRSLGPRCQQHQPINFARLGFNRGIGGRCASKARSDNGYGFRAGLVEVAYCGQYVVLDAFVSGLRLGSVRLAAPAEVDGQCAKSGLNERLRLLLPALLVEAASMRQHHAALALPVDIRVDDASVLSRKGDVLLRRGKPRQKESRKERSEGEHEGIVLPLVIDFLDNSRNKPRVLTDTAWVDHMVVLLDICRGQRFHLCDKRCEKGVDGHTRSRTDVFQSGRYCSRRATSWPMPNSKCQ